MEEQEIDVEVPSWFSDTFDAIGANYVEKDGKVAADTPWGSGYSPTRYADLNVTEREQADAMTKRWDEDDNFTMIEQANGTKTYVDKTSGFSANTDQLMLTANADGKYEVASMFDIGMFTGAVAEAREELNIQKAMLGLDTDTKEDNQGPAEATNVAEPVEESTQDPAIKGLPDDEKQAYYERTGKQPDTNIAVEMLKTDLSNDTSMVGEASAPIAAKGDTFSYIGANGNEVTLESDAYDMKVIEKQGKQVEGAVENYMKSKGIKPGDKGYEDTFNKVRGMFIDQIVNESKYAVADEPTQDKPVAEGPRGKGPSKEASASVHWLDRGKDNASNLNGKTDGYKRKYKNKYGEDNNYGNYNTEKEWNKSWTNTLNKLYDGKINAKQEAAIDDMLSNKELYHNLGIATPAQIEAYNIDKDVYKAAMKSAGTTGGKRAQLKMKQADVRAEVDNQLATELEDPSKYAIDVVGKLTRNQVKAFYANRDEKNKPTKQQSEKLVALRDSGTRIRRMQTLANGADLEAMEKVSPIDRAGVFIGKFFGGAKDKELKTVLLGMAKDEMVSRTVKEISGAAASDQERAFIKSWLLGADGASVQQFRSTLNSIQERIYDDAKKFGERLYMQGKIGALYELSQDTGDLKDLPKKIEKVK